MAPQRLQKLLAQAGVASRRAAEELILKGRVRVNGRIVRELGTRADLHADRVEVDGRRLVPEKPAYYLLHKPREMVTTLSDPEGRESLAEVLVQVPERCFPVGRLDYHTSGALLLTNDGEMADALLHPTQGVPKVYIAKMKGTVDEQGLSALRNGVVLDDGYTTSKAEVFVLREERGNSWLSITIREGKNRQIHRMGDAIGHRVMRLSRSAFAGLSVEGMRPGALRPLSTKEIDKLKKDYLNPKRRRKSNERRRVEAEANAEFFEGWGEEVVSEPPAPAGKPRRPARGAGARSGDTSDSRTNPAAARAVRALEERRPAPRSRSIGGARNEGGPAKKKAASPKAAAKGVSRKTSTAAKGGARKTATPAKGGGARKAAASKKAAPGSRGGRQATGAKAGNAPAKAAAGQGRSVRKTGAKSSSAGSAKPAARPTGKPTTKPGRANRAGASGARSKPAQKGKGKRSR